MRGAVVFFLSVFLQDLAVQISFRSSALTWGDMVQNAEGGIRKKKGKRAAFRRYVRIYSRRTPVRFLLYLAFKIHLISLRCRTVSFFLPSPEASK